MADDLGYGNFPTLNAAFSRDRWEFVGSNSDQGFFWFMYYVRQPIGAYFRFWEAQVRIQHWWGAPKPWDAAKIIANTSDTGAVGAWLFDRARSYLARSELADGDREAAPAVVRELWRLRRALEDDWRWDLIGDRVGSVPGTFPLW